MHRYHYRPLIPAKAGIQIAAIVRRISLLAQSALLLDPRFRGDERGEFEPSILQFMNKESRYASTTR
jgi:hypothetical protein